MATIKLINLSTPNDGLGDPLRDGGTDINANFTALNTDKLETGGYKGDAQDLKDLIDANTVQIDTKPTLSADQAWTGINTFANVVASSIASDEITVDVFKTGTSTGLTKNVVTTNGTAVFENGILVNFII